jgi:hypothetical protein
MIPTAICERVATTSSAPAATMPASAIILVSLTRASDQLLRRWFRGLWLTAGFLLGAGFLVLWLPAGVRGFRAHSGMRLARPALHMWLGSKRRPGRLSSATVVV